MSLTRQLKKHIGVSSLNQHVFGGRNSSLGNSPGAVCSGRGSNLGSCRPIVWECMGIGFAPQYETQANGVELKTKSDGCLAALSTSHHFTEAANVLAAFDPSQRLPSAVHSGGDQTDRSEAVETRGRHHCSRSAPDCHRQWREKVDFDESAL